jgi:hypothetical protein
MSPDATQGEADLTAETQEAERTETQEAERKVQRLEAQLAELRLGVKSN